MELARVREALGRLISHAIAARISRHQQQCPDATGYIRRFAEHLVGKAAHRSVLARSARSADAAKAYDPVSIISLNWDVLLDNAGCATQKWQFARVPFLWHVSECLYTLSIGRPPLCQILCRSWKLSAPKSFVNSPPSAICAQVRSALSLAAAESPPATAASPTTRDTSHKFDSPVK